MEGIRGGAKAGTKAMPLKKITKKRNSIRGHHRQERRNRKMRGSWQRLVGFVKEPEKKNNKVQSGNESKKTAQLKVCASHFEKPPNAESEKKKDDLQAKRVEARETKDKPLFPDTSARRNQGSD